MNERLLRAPVAPREVEPSISPQLQEVLFRALEREPRNRYATAHEFILDLRHLDRVGITDREEMKGWRKSIARKGSRNLAWIALILIPVLLFVAMLLLAHISR
jgi:serine/threonine-protein kinase